ncbi:hypothetical protein cyc_08342 [Cyclospora cayetanensis]|uniref:tRNA pseudouridine(55) synthase n=1 Tax=Cyclospora cayetanensis TaxID=88456 RepID=A0A1D3CSA0_9EIME|nr:hypothetical protein cyc_08342 [Cyclospora cayetanensis]
MRGGKKQKQPDRQTRSNSEARGSPAVGRCATAPAPSPEPFFRGFSADKIRFEVKYVEKNANKGTLQRSQGSAAGTAAAVAAAHEFSFGCLVVLVAAPSSSSSIPREASLHLSPCLETPSSRRMAAAQTHETAVVLAEEASSCCWRCKLRQTGCTDIRRYELFGEGAPFRHGPPGQKLEVEVSAESSAGSELLPGGVAGSSCFDVELLLALLRCSTACLASFHAKQQPHDRQLAADASFPDWAPPEACGLHAFVRCAVHEGAPCGASWGPPGAAEPSQKEDRAASQAAAAASTSRGGACLGLLKGLSCELRCLLVTGRYTKFSRALSQAEWCVDGQRKLNMSVEEALGIPLQRLFGAQSFKFMAAGR